MERASLLPRAGLVSCEGVASRTSSQSNARAPWPRSCAVHRPLCLPTLPPLVPCRCAITLVIQRRRRRLPATPFFLFSFSSLEAESGRIVPSVFAFCTPPSSVARSAPPHHTFRHASIRPSDVAYCCQRTAFFSLHPFRSLLLLLHPGRTFISLRPLVSGVDLLAPSAYIRSDPLAYSPFHLLGTPLCSAASSARAPFDKDRASCPRARLASWLPSSPPSTIPRPCIRLYPGYHTAPSVRPLGFPSDPFWRRGSYKRRATSRSPIWLPPTVPEACLATWPLEQSSRPPAA